MTKSPKANSTKYLAIAGGATLLLVAVLVYVIFVRPSAKPPADIGNIGTGQTNGTDGPARTSADGTWVVTQNETVFVGYRVEEEIAEVGSRTASGRSPAVEGSITVSGATVPAASFTVDMTKLASDLTQREVQNQTQGLQTINYPTASFKLTEPVTLPAVPRNGEEFAVNAKGELTLHGVTKPVEIALRAKWSDNTISVSTTGNGIPIKFSDYRIEPIELANFVKTADNGTIELQLLFRPA